jgi:hypothetical protein
MVLMIIKTSQALQNYHELKLARTTQSSCIERESNGGGSCCNGSATPIAHATAAPAGVRAPQAAAASSISEMRAVDSTELEPVNRGVKTD